MPFWVNPSAHLPDSAPGPRASPCRCLCHRWKRHHRSLFALGCAKKGPEWGTNVGQFCMATLKKMKNSIIYICPCFSGMLLFHLIGGCYNIHISHIYIYIVYTYIYIYIIKQYGCNSRPTNTMFHHFRTILMFTEPRLWPASRQPACGVSWVEVLFIASWYVVTWGSPMT